MQCALQTQTADEDYVIQSFFSLILFLVVQLMDFDVRLFSQLMFPMSRMDFEIQ